VRPVMAVGQVQVERSQVSKDAALKFCGASSLLLLGLPYSSRWQIPEERAIHLSRARWALNRNHIKLRRTNLPS
jgi:hypothetical protein